MADYNQALNLRAARERCRQPDDEGLYWIEEPVRHDDYAASAELATPLETPVQIGENFAGRGPWRGRCRSTRAIS